MGQEISQEAAEELLEAARIIRDTEVPSDKEWKRFEAAIQKAEGRRANTAATSTDNHLHQEKSRLGYMQGFTTVAVLTREERLSWE